MNQTSVPTRAANDPASGGTAWINVELATATTGSGASVSLAAGSDSQWLAFKGMQWSIPTGARFQGVEPVLNLSASLLGMISITDVRIIVGDVRQTVSLIAAPIAVVLSFVETTLGSVNSTFTDATLVSSLINDGLFGFAVRIRNSGALTTSANLRGVLVRATFDLPVIHNLGGAVIGR